MSVSDFSGRLDDPSTGRLQRLLSNSASTDCCNIRFSLRMMTSGAFRSTSFFSRLLRLMMRRYRSFKSDVAKLPLSSSTSGRRSGGMTGMHSSTIHSHLLLLSRKLSTVLSRLTKSLVRCFDAFSPRNISFSSRSRKSRDTSTRFNFSSNFLTASAPMSTSNVSPNSAR